MKQHLEMRARSGCYIDDMDDVRLYMSCCIRQGGFAIDDSDYVVPEWY
jgi:hypothetical protein